MEVKWDQQWKDISIRVKNFTFRWSGIDTMEQTEIDYLKTALGLKQTTQEELKKEIRHRAHTVYTMPNKPESDSNKYGKTAKGKDVDHPASFTGGSIDSNICNSDDSINKDQVYSDDFINKYRPDSGFNTDRNKIQYGPPRYNTDRNNIHYGPPRYNTDRNNIHYGPPQGTDHDESEMIKTKEQLKRRNDICHQIEKEGFGKLKVLFSFLIKIYSV